MNKTEIIIVLIYLIIGRLMHEYTEPKLTRKSLFNYNKVELIMYFMDLFLWPVFLIISIFYPIKK